MEPLLGSRRRQIKPQQPNEERRSARRYPVRLPVQWKLKQGKGAAAAGIGATMNLSSKGILIETGRDLPVGRALELSVSWPCLLLGAVALQLLVIGEIVRVERGCVAVRMLHHEFRTLGSANGGTDGTP